MAGKLSFSYSKMSTYQECPLKYKFRYVDKLYEPPKYFFAFGTALHKVMEYLYSSQKPPFPTLQEVLDFFKKDWESTTWQEKGYESAEKELACYDEGFIIITAYYQKFCKEFFAPVSTEFRTAVDFGDISVVGIVDRIDYLGGGKISIVDYKTGKKIKREPDQLMMYQKLLFGNKELEERVKVCHPRVKNIEVSNMLFLHLKGPEFEQQHFSPASDEEMQDFWARALGVADSIKKEKFDANPGEMQCRFCDFKKHCPVWNLDKSDGRDFALEQQPQQEIPPAVQEPQNPLDKLSLLADRYGKALKEVKDLEQEIISLMRQEDINRHFGKEFEVNLTKIKTVNFKDRKKTLDTLKELNLLGKTVAPTLGKIKALLDDPSVSDGQKAALSALADFGEEYKLDCIKTDK